MDNLYIDIIERASKCNGKVYGGFVRDYLVPFLNNRRTFKPKDIDMWFDCETNIDTFIKDLRNVYNVFNIFKFGPGQYGININRTILSVESNGKSVDIDLVYSLELPVNDFNVNKLCYTCEKGVFIPYNYDQEIVNNILQKEAYMLPGYIKYLISDTPWISSSLLSRIYSSLHLRGYSIYMHDYDKINFDRKDLNVTSYIKRYENTTHITYR